MTLDFRATAESRGIDARFTLESGRTLAVLGPNGAGKSSVLAMIAGLLRPDFGRAELDGTVLFDLPANGSASGTLNGGTAAPDRPVWLPPHTRSVSLLAQEALLFPHLTALQNVAFGPQSAGAGTARSRSLAREWLDRVGAAQLAQSRPGELSGGQAQRVAIARALASAPRLLLLDEPMAALDVSVAPAMRSLLREVLVDRTAIIVTHEVLDAYTLADTVMVMGEGRILEFGPTRQVLERPRNRFTADLVALNLITGVRTATGLRTENGVDVTAGVRGDATARARVAVAVAPSAIRVSGAGIAGPKPAVPNTFAAIVTDIEPRSDVVRVRAGGIAADIAPRLVAELGLGPGDTVMMRFDAADAVLYPL